MTLSSHPSTGIGTPQDMSLVMALSWMPSSSQFLVNVLTLDLQ